MSACVSLNMVTAPHNRANRANRANQRAQHQAARIRSEDVIAALARANGGEPEPNDVEVIDCTLCSRSAQYEVGSRATSRIETSAVLSEPPT